MIKSIHGEPLHQIGLHHLKIGMLLNDDIYNFNGKVVLLSKGTEIDEDKLKRLIRFNAGKNNICVSEEIKNNILNSNETKKHNHSEYTENKVEKEIGYNKIQNSVKNFLDRVSTTNTLEEKVANNLKNEIAKTIETANVYSILNCISSPRPIDEDLQRHCVNVSFLNGLMGKWLKLDEPSIENLILVGLLHDVGKTKIPTNILNNPKKLTNEEFEVIKCHPVYSYDILKENRGFSEEVLVSVKYHHEKVDGSGYPDGISGNKIPLFAKITAISDIYDAMVSKRVYKEKNNPLSVLSLFNEHQLSSLDEHLVNIFIRKLPASFIETPVVMNTGQVGIIKHIMPNDWEYPIIDIDGVIIQTSEELKCVDFFPQI